MNQKIKVKPASGINTRVIVKVQTIPNKNISNFVWNSYTTPPEPADAEDPFYSPTVLLRWNSDGNSDFGFNYSTGYFNFPQEDDDIVNEWWIDSENLDEKNDKELRTLEWTYFEHLV